MVGRRIYKDNSARQRTYRKPQTVVRVLPARTDSAWWHDYVMRAEVRFLRGWVRFGGSKSSAPFPT